MKKAKVLKSLREVGKDFLREETAVGVIELILILVVLIALVVLFKDQLTSLVETLLSKVTKQSNSI